MKRYAEYKDSGIEWIGEIPKEWKITKFKYISTIYTGNSLNDAEKDIYASVENGYKYISTKDVDLDKKTINYDTEFTIPFDNKGFKIAPKDSFIMCIEGGSAGKKNAYITEEIAFVNKLCCFVGKKNAVCKYLYYLSNSYVFCESFTLNMTGLIGGVSVSAINNFYSILPPFPTQQAITDYLDRKTATIDALIADKQKLTELLREKRQALISEAVTKGLDKNATMKNSGIKWIGEIPAHWDVLSNHQLFVERNQKNTDANVELLSVTKYLGVILQSLAQELRLATTAPADSTEGYKIVKKGDLVMNIMRAKDGSYGISSYDGVISPAYCIYQARKKCNPQFLYYLFKTPKYVQIFKCYSTGIAEHRMRLYPEDFNQIPAILPPITEQDKIVKKLDAESKQSDEVIALIEQQIEKLKEYRLTIISEVVTGKVVV